MIEVEETSPQRDPDPERGDSALAATLADLLDGAVARVGDFARLDTGRQRRTGVPEVVFAEGKTPEQTLRLLAELRDRAPETPALATRCPQEVLAAAPDAFPGQPVLVDPVARTVTVGDPPAEHGSVSVLTAGTSDLPVARECVAALSAWGVRTRLLDDVGVAGLPRLLEHLADIRDADCVIVVAGMDGALPSVVTGLVPAPVVGVPTSVGYGFADGGRAAAASMLSSCAPGLTVVNIDNGFGAAAHAAKIVRRMHGG
ncbi:1-(5-phosphoribosyl)-5-amino-4-imidazole-carboxylate carboxylase [Wenjunlia vitaminophila]|uniref:1-(5-phosphoribosyl)-5-amino-4-imidazole-carboxylate carboxylase n=1 Tax=Wenjunlia vitaminophila TaxID=76728 RepID=A0A0T6LWM4_WENVI|nr:nickel pincer cofactor biosynthesis protein LarB [Wenjunlia vitaminophila]KRV50507.1 1-(5-phosphoribosyl)-5-amino-4-imidazole-carboxylate carboxylase [Wenjunlia vitaminophila]